MFPWTARDNRAKRHIANTRCPLCFYSEVNTWTYAGAGGPGRKRRPFYGPCAPRHALDTQGLCLLSTAKLPTTPQDKRVQSRWGMQAPTCQESHSLLPHLRGAEMCLPELESQPPGKSRQILHQTLHIVPGWLPVSPLDAPSEFSSPWSLPLTARVTVVLELHREGWVAGLTGGNPLDATSPVHALGFATCRLTCVGAAYRTHLAKPAPPYVHSGQGQQKGAPRCGEMSPWTLIWWP